jgi:hypothetical protein
MTLDAPGISADYIKVVVPSEFRPKNPGTTPFFGEKKGLFDTQPSLFEGVMSGDGVILIEGTTVSSTMYHIRNFGWEII